VGLFPTTSGLVLSAPAVYSCKLGPAVVVMVWATAGFLLFARRVLYACSAAALDLADSRRILPGSR
jgi:hypothetical protein